MDDDSPLAQVRWAAARARAAGWAPTSARGLLAQLPAQVWRVVETGDQVQLAIASDYQLHQVDHHELPVARLTPTQTRALLGVLVATSTGAAHPWLGQPAQVADVLAVLGGALLPEGTVSHLRSALKRLHAFRLVVLDHADPQQPVSAADQVLVTVGPAVATWAGPWVRDLQVLIARVAVEHPRSA